MSISEFRGLPNRPLAGYADHEMPIPALYMCGTSPGLGVRLARKLLSDNA